MPTTAASLAPAYELPKPDDLVDAIAGFPTYRGVERAALEWLVDQSTYHLWPKGEDLYEVGTQVNSMDTIVRGRYQVLMPKQGRVREIGTYATGYVTGVLPFSRMTQTVASLRMLEDTYVMRTPKACFTEMVVVSYPLVQNLVAAMSTRIREFSDIRAQDEKMMSLGKLSAGLAHELNNPSAAIVRSAEELHAELHNTPESFKAIMTMQVTPAEVDAINEIMFARLAAMHAEPDERSALDRLDDAEQLEDWLDDVGLRLDSEVVEAFTAARFTAADLQRVYDICDGRSMGGLLGWLAKNITLETLTAEIRDAAGRISELVGSVKSYTHMDRDAGPEALDLHEGLRSTLVLLKHRFRQQGVTLRKDFAEGLPRVRVWGGQVNQVYTNLIDNAIDAAGEGGTVTVRTELAGGRDDQVCVAIEDDGPGVPEELRQRIFEPFFTTKDVGKGTGMGLDIAQKILARHDSSLQLESAPGRTIFRFCLPVG